MPPLAPLKRTNKLPADGGNNITTTGYLTEKGFEEKMAKYEEIPTPLPPDAPLQDIEKCRALLVEQATKITERELDLTNKETEFVRKQRKMQLTMFSVRLAIRTCTRSWISAASGKTNMPTRSGENTTMYGTR